MRIFINISKFMEFNVECPKMKAFMRVKLSFEQFFFKLKGTVCWLKFKAKPCPYVFASLLKLLLAYILKSIHHRTKTVI